MYLKLLSKQTYFTINNSEKKKKIFSFIYLYLLKKTREKMNLIALLVICPSFLLVTCATERHLKAKLYPSSTTKSQWSSFKFSNKRLYKNSSEETKRQVLIIFDYILQVLL